MPFNILDTILPKKEGKYVPTFSLFALGGDLVGLETQVEIFFVRVWRNIQLYLTSTAAGRGREGVIQISYNWSPLSSTLLILHLTTSLYGGREGCLVSLHIMRPNTQLYLVERVRHGVGVPLDWVVTFGYSHFNWGEYGGFLFEGNIWR